MSNSGVGKVKNQRYHSRSKVSSADLLGKCNRELKEFHNAVLAGRTVKVMELLSNGTRADLSDDKGRTGLHFAASRGDEAMVNLLLQHGGNVNQKDCLGNTPLHLAVCNNCTPVVTALLRAGTDLSSLNRHGKTPLHLAHSRLNVLNDEYYKTQPIEETKKQITEILQMLQEYFQIQNERHTDVDHLVSLASKLTLSETPQQVGSFTDYGHCHLQLVPPPKALHPARPSHGRNTHEQTNMQAKLS